MKKILVLALVFVSFFWCCSGNDCSVEEWIGTYIGTKTCGLESEFNYTFRITDLPFPNDVRTNILAIENFTITVDGCDVIGGSTDIGVNSETFEGSMYNGKIKIRANFLNGSCVYEGTKQ